MKASLKLSPRQCVTKPLTLQAALTEAKNLALESQKAALAEAASAAQKEALEEQKSTLNKVYAAEKAAYLAESKALADVALANSKAECQVLGPVVTNCPRFSEPVARYFGK